MNSPFTITEAPKTLFGLQAIYRGVMYEITAPRKVNRTGQTLKYRGISYQSQSRDRSSVQQSRNGCYRGIKHPIYTFQ